MAQHEQLDVPRPSGSAADGGEIGEQADLGVEDRWEQRRLLRRERRTLVDRVRRPTAEYSYRTFDLVVPPPARIGTWRRRHPPVRRLHVVQGRRRQPAAEPLLQLQQGHRLRGVGELRRDGRAGAAVAGPAAAVLRAGELPAASVDWLKATSLETELELGQLPAAAAGGAVRVRPLPERRHVRHYIGVRAAAAQPAGAGTGTHRGCHGAGVGARGRAPPLHRRAHRAAPGGSGRARRDGRAPGDQPGSG